MKYYQVLKYAMRGVSDQLTKEKERLENGSGPIAAQRVKKLQKDFDRISDMIYTEETGEVR